MLAFGIVLLLFVSRVTEYFIYIEIELIISKVLN